MISELNEHSREEISSAKNLLKFRLKPLLDGKL